MRKLSYVYSIIIGIFIIIILLNVFVIKGIIGAATWTIAKLIIGPLGVVLSIGALIYVIIGMIKRVNIGPRCLAFVLSVLLGTPTLLLLNVVEMAYPLSIENAGEYLVIESPFKTEVTVGWGGDAFIDNQPHSIWASERWAYDIVLEPYDINSSDLMAYGIYGVSVYSPVNGEIVAIHDGEDDIEPQTESFSSLEGNHIYIKVEGTDFYLLMNHFKKNSINLKNGDQVKIGDYLGQVGNSGATSEPHLHIHVQRQHPKEILFPTFAEGIPLYFNDGQHKYMPVRGEKIKSIQWE